jgi:hypothetical protein
MSYTNFKYVGQMSYSLYKAVLHPPKLILKLCIYGYYHYLKVVLKIEQSSQTDKQKTEKQAEHSMCVVGGMRERPVLDKETEERLGKIKPVEHVEVRLDEGVFAKLDEGLYVRKTKDGTIEFYEEEQ